MKMQNLEIKSFRDNIIDGIDDVAYGLLFLGENGMMGELPRAEDLKKEEYARIRSY